MPNNPIVNHRIKYVNGLNLTWTDANNISIAAGYCSNSTNVNDIVVESALTVTRTVSGAGGLDTGTIANDTLYYLYVVADSTGYESAVGLFSLSATAPTLPFGYDMFLRVGAFRHGTAAILAFDQRGLDGARTMWYRASLATDITAGSSATFAAVNLTGLVPAINTDVIFKCTYTPTAANDELALRSGDSATDEGQAVASGAAAGVVEVVMLTCPSSSVVLSGVDYKVTGSATAINVQGYVDQLLA